MRYLKLALAMFLIMSVPAFAENEERPPVGKYAKAFTGPEGLVVATLRIGMAEKDEFLIQFAGIDHDWDLKIFKAKKVPAAHGHAYEVNVDGEPRRLLVAKNASGGSYEYTAYVTDAPYGVKVNYDESYSRRIPPQHFLTDYLKQNEGEKTGPVWR